MELIIFVIIVLALLLKHPSVKGYIGEKRIQSIIGKSSQIDHILINRNGIFVIETKNYSGRIYGNNMQQEWTQVLKYGKVKNKFYNPVKQNLTHIYRIKEVLETNIPIKSMVVFVKGNTKYIDSKDVYTPSELKKEIQKSQLQQLKNKEMRDVYNQLMEIKNNPELSIKDHKKTILKTIEEIEQGICPRCGAKLKERKGQYGVFYGCTNYPKCKFTKK